MVKFFVSIVFYLAIILSTYDEVYGTKTIANFIEHLGKGINGNSKFIEEKRYIIALYFWYKQRIQGL